MSGSDLGKAGSASVKKSAFTPKRILALIVVVIALVLIVANIQSAQVNLLFTTIQMPLALLLAGMFVLGWIASWLTAKFRK